MKSKIKVVYLLNHISNGGIEHFLLNYLKNNPTKEYFEVSLIYSDMCNLEMCEQFEELGVKIIKTNHTINNNQIVYFFDLVKIFHRNKYDVVHCNISQNNFYGLIAGILTKTKVRISHSHMNIQECHKGSKTNLIRNFIRNTKIRLSDLLATNRLACSEIAGKSSFSKPFTVIPNAIQIDRFIYDKNIRKHMRERMNIGNSHLYGFFGRLHEDKNPFFALKVFENIKKQDTKAKFLIIGYGALKEKVLNYIKNSPYKKDIIYIESVTDIWNYYQAIDELIFPSKSEGLGMVAIEAQISGLPVITTTGVPQEVKISNHIEFLGLDDPIEKWVDKCLSMTELDRKNASFTENYDNYNIKKQAYKLFSIYQKNN